MIGLGLSAAQLKKYSTALRSSHALSVRVSLLDGNESRVCRFPKSTTDDSSPISVVGGQVDIDTTQGSTTPYRKLTLSLLDPQKKMQVGLNSAGDYSIWANTFIMVERGDYTEGLGYVWCPVFTGPILTFDRSGPEVTITAGGKETLAQAPYGILTAQKIPAGTLVTTAIKQVLGALGEQKFGMSSSTEKVTEETTIPARGAVWPYCLKWANTAQLELYYDGAGYVRLEKRTRNNAAWRFDTDSQTGMLLSSPDLSYDFTGGQPLGGQVSVGGGAFANYVYVVGATPTKTVPQPTAAATAAASNDLSPGALGRNGKPRYAIISISDSSLKQQTKAQARADTTLADAIEVAQTSKFDAMPVPCLEEFDWVAVQTLSGDVLSVQMNTWSIPLSSDAMTIGALRQMDYTKGLRPKRVSRKHVKTKKKTRKT